MDVGFVVKTGNWLADTGLVEREKKYGMGGIEGKVDFIELLGPTSSD